LAIDDSRKWSTILRDRWDLPRRQLGTSPAHLDDLVFRFDRRSQETDLYLDPDSRLYRGDLLHLLTRPRVRATTAPSSISVAQSASLTGADIAGTAIASATL